MTGFNSYDQWKTASPYDDNDGEYGEQWHCWKFNRDSKKWDYLGCMNLPENCDCNELYELMEMRCWIDTINDYNIDGEKNHIAVMGKKDEHDDFGWHFGQRLYTYDGIPCQILAGDRDYDSDEIVEIEPIFEHDSYDDSFPVKYSDLVDTGQAGHDIAKMLFDEYLKK